MEQSFYTSNLFRDVQMQRVFVDSKTFSDAIPGKPIAVIEALYKKEKNNPGFDLETFIKDNFSLPNASSDQSENELPEHENDLIGHIDLLWDFLTREADKDDTASSLIALPHPYIVPGGRFREIYYWDSYFTMLGLQVSGRIELIQHMIDNFSYLINLIGHIPNGNRTYYESRSSLLFMY